MLKRNSAVSVIRGTPRKTESRLLFMLLLLLLELFPLDHANAQQPLSAPAAAASSSGLKLVGIIRSSYFSGAVLSDSSGTQSFFRLYDTLPDGFKLVRILPDSILLNNSDGIQYELILSQTMISSGQTPLPPTNIQPMKQEETAPRTRRKTQR